MHELLGLPTQASVDFRTWTNTLLSADANQPAQSRSAMANMRRFLIEQVARKRARPGDDLLDRFPGIRLAVPAHDIRWRESFRLRGLIALPVFR